MLQSTERTQTMEDLLKELHSDEPEEEQNGELYRSTIRLMNNAETVKNGKAKINIYQSAISLLEKIPGYKDSTEKITECRNKISRIESSSTSQKIIENRPESKRKTIIIGHAVALIAIAVLLLLLFRNTQIPAQTESIPNTEVPAEQLSPEPEDNPTEIIFVQPATESLSPKLEEVTSTLTSEPTTTPTPEQTSMPEQALTTESSLGVRDCDLTIGSTVTFGRYEQDKNTENGPDAIEWIVLDVQKGKALLLSKYGLDAKPYNTKYTDITWEKSTIRSWLNNDFLNKAFTDTEKTAILMTEVDNGSTQGYSGWSTNGGNNTKDQIFLLSYKEANKYLGVEHWKVTASDQNTKSRAAPTAYARLQGAYINDRYDTADGEAAGWWWLRSPGNKQNLAANVDSEGSLNYSTVSTYYGIARPAFWLNLESDIFKSESSDALGTRKSASTPMPEPTATTESTLTSESTLGVRDGELTIGSTVTFGRYEQDNNTENGSEAIKWIVLDVHNGKALLLSKYGLDTKPYNTEYTDITWETSTIRSWLNSDFLNKAFMDTEKSAILMTEVDNSSSQGYSAWSTSGEKNTQDKIFLLSYAEANKYLGAEDMVVSGSDRNTKSRAAPTAYAKAQGAYIIDRSETADGETAAWWWLRLSGYYQDFAAFVYDDGSVDLIYVDEDGLVARPALWINLESDIFKSENSGTSDNRKLTPTLFGFKDARCEERTFSTKIPTDATANWNKDYRMYAIWLEKEGYIPDIYIRRRTAEEKLKNPENYIKNVYTNLMEKKYGDRLEGTVLHEYYDIGGKHLLASSYIYRHESGVAINRLVLVEVRDDGDVEYIARYQDSAKDETLAALDAVVRYYQPD